MDQLVNLLQDHSSRSTADVVDGLSKLLEHLQIHKDEDKQGAIEELIERSLPSALFSVLSTRQNKDCLLNAKVAELIAELAKSDVARESCVEAKLIPQLLEILDTQGSELTVQVCRALGNICYENDNARRAIVNQQGISRLIDLLRGLCRPVDSTSSVDMKHLRSVATGFLLNLCNTHEESQGQLIEEGIVNVLQRYIDQHCDEENVCMHVLLVLNCLYDTDRYKQEIFSKSLLMSIVNLLVKDNSLEMVETCLELIASIAENDSMKCVLTELGLCEKLIDIVSKHYSTSAEESDHIVKIACDLLVIILTGDASMEKLFDLGNGSLYEESVKWIRSSNETLQVSGSLAIGNFARNDTHCKMMISGGIPKDLLNLLKNHTDKQGDIRLQHAVLSALRNLAVNSDNKPALLQYDVIDTVLPMIEIETYPVVFKLLGLLRMLTDKQEATATGLGTNVKLLKRLIKWCSIDDHPGVQGESQRLLAWLVKNSMSKEVMGAVIEHDGLSFLVDMITSEHSVMQNEAILSMILIYNHIKDTPTELKVIPDLAKSLHKLFERPNCIPEILLNAITLVGQLASSALMKKELKQFGIVDDLKKLADQKETCLSASEVLHTLEAS